MKLDQVTIPIFLEAILGAIEEVPLVGRTVKELDRAGIFIQGPIGLLEIYPEGVSDGWVQFVSAFLPPAAPQPFWLG